MPWSLSLRAGAWWSTTMNVLNPDRIEEIKLANQAREFYKQLEEVSPFGLRERFDED